VGINNEFVLEIISTITPSPKSLHTKNNKPPSKSGTEENYATNYATIEYMAIIHEYLEY